MWSCKRTYRPDCTDTSNRPTKQPAHNALHSATDPPSSIGLTSETYRRYPDTCFPMKWQADTIQGPTCEAGCSSDFCCSLSSVTLTSTDSPRPCLICPCWLHSAANRHHLYLFCNVLTTLQEWSCIISVTFLPTVHAPSWLFLRQLASASRSRRDDHVLCSVAGREGATALSVTADRHHFNHVTSLRIYFEWHNEVIYIE